MLIHPIWQSARRVFDAIDDRLFDAGDGSHGIDVEEFVEFMGGSAEVPCSCNPYGESLLQL